MTVPIDNYHLFYLRVAANEWLRKNKDNPNAPAVTAALVATNPTDPRRHVAGVPTDQEAPERTQ